MSTTPTLTEAQWRALVAMTRCARCVGHALTEVQIGYVNTTAARSLVAAGLAREEIGATGANVFVLTDEGWDLAWAEADESTPPEP